MRYYMDSRGYKVRTVGEAIDYVFLLEAVPGTVDRRVRFVRRRVDYWEACGQFSFPVVRIKGKRVRPLVDDFYKVADPADPLHVRRPVGYVDGFDLRGDAEVYYKLLGATIE